MPTGRNTWRASSSARSPGFTTSPTNSSAATCRPSWRCCRSSNRPTTPSPIPAAAPWAPGSSSSATGKRYGLDQNWWYDGRRDVWASTDAALRYLNDLAVMFDGDWLLALAGYNSGEGRVARQVKKNQAAGKPADFWNLKLPRGNPRLRAQTAGPDLPVQVSRTLRFRIARHTRPAGHRSGRPRPAGRPGAGGADGRSADRRPVHAEPRLQPLGHLAGRALTAWCCRWKAPRRCRTAWRVSTIRP